MQKKQTPKIIHHSGGRSSSLMTLLTYSKGDLVIFCDTGREALGTYKFIDDFQRNEHIPIIKLKYQGGFESLLKKERGIPNPFKRFCTKHLKVKLARRYIRSLGYYSYNQYIGLRHDERSRIASYKENWQNVTTKFPLADQKITKEDVLHYWSLKTYNLEIPEILGNCDLCFNKGKNTLIQIMKQYPKLADKWIQDEQNSIGHHTYFKDISMLELFNISKENNNHKQDLGLITPSTHCLCTS